MARKLAAAPEEVRPASWNVKKRNAVTVKCNQVQGDNPETA